MASGSSKVQTLAVASRSRKLPSWISCWVDATEGSGSPEALRRWAGIATISAALERRVWVANRKGKLYANQFIFLVAPPGIGKSVMLGRVRELLANVGDDHGRGRLKLGPTSVSSSSLADALADAERRVTVLTNDPPYDKFHSLQVVTSELGEFLPEYDSRMMNVLTNLWDCMIYDERKRGGNLRIELPKPQLSIIGATTPGHLNKFLPPEAWDQGFMSRTILIYSGDVIRQPIFNDAAPLALPPELLDDLNRIFDLYGQFTVTPGAGHLLNEWHLNGEEPMPTHPKLLNYNTRRLAHLIKLSMVASVDASDSLIIDEQNVVDALSWLTEAEESMPEIFKASGLSGDSGVMEDCFAYAFNIYAKEKKPLHQSRVIDFLRQRLAGAYVFRILDVMVAAGMFAKVTEKGLAPVPADAIPYYKPLPKTRHLG